jgi:hypothetical protein
MTTAAAAGVDEHVIMEQTGHSVFDQLFSAK